MLAEPGERFYFSLDLPTAYRVSNYGRILSLGYVVHKSDGRPKTVAPRILKTPANSNGYAVLTLRVNGQKQAFRVHQLVARCFLPNVPGKFLPNHKDGNKLNNRADNLEWASHSDNLRHAYAIGLRAANVAPAIAAHQFNASQRHV